MRIEKYVESHMSAFIGRLAYHCCYFPLVSFSHAPSAGLSSLFDRDQLKTILIWIDFRAIFHEILWFSSHDTKIHLVYLWAFSQSHARQIFHAEIIRMLCKLWKIMQKMLTRYFKIMLNPFSHSCIKLQQLYQITWTVSCPTRPVLVDREPVSTRLSRKMGTNNRNILLEWRMLLLSHLYLESIAIKTL